MPSLKLLSGLRARGQAEAVSSRDHQGASLCPHFCGGALRPAWVSCRLGGLAGCCQPSGLERHRQGGPTLAVRTASRKPLVVLSLSFASEAALPCLAGLLQQLRGLPWQQPACRGRSCSPSPSSWAHSPHGGAIVVLGHRAFGVAVLDFKVPACPADCCRGPLAELSQSLPLCCGNRLPCACPERCWLGSAGAGRCMGRSLPKL